MGSVGAKNNNILLGVNIDHVATLRQARGTDYPDPMQAVQIAVDAGADSITLHLREDRRHIQEADVAALNSMADTRMNLEMAVTDEMIRIAEKYQPADCCLVPERREELTTEGGLDVAGQLTKVTEACDMLAAAGVSVSLFIDADPVQIAAAARTGAACIEIHTGHFADAAEGLETSAELEKIVIAVKQGVDAGLTVHAGHGLHYENVQAIAKLADVRELNIGHAIVARAVFSGLAGAVSEMKRLMVAARQDG